MLHFFVAHRGSQLTFQMSRWCCWWMIVIICWWLPVTNLYASPMNIHTLADLELHQAIWCSAPNKLLTFQTSRYQYQYYDTMIIIIWRKKTNIIMPYDDGSSKNTSQIFQHRIPMKHFPRHKGLWNTTQYAYSRSPLSPVVSCCQVVQKFWPDVEAVDDLAGIKLAAIKPLSCCCHAVKNCFQSIVLSTQLKCSNISYWWYQSKVSCNC